MYEIKINPDSLKDLYKAVDGFEREVPRHLRAAVNTTAKTIRAKIAQALGKKMVIKNNFPPKNVTPAVTLKRSIKAKTMATLEKAEARLGFDGGFPFPLKYFNARPLIKRSKGKKRYAGVKYTSYKPQGMRKNTQYFMVASRNHHVYERKTDQPKPIRRVYGEKPGDYFSDIQAIPMARRIAEERLPKELKRRIRAILLEKQGIIKLKTSRGR